MVQMRAEEKKQLAKGVSVTALYDPSSPEYLGKHIRGFMRENQDIMTSFVERLTGEDPDPEGTAGLAPIGSLLGKGTLTPAGAGLPANEARLPNESAADYVNRIGKQKK